MAFVVEDGSGLSDANSYITVQEFTDFHTDRGTFASGDFSTTEIQQGAVNATDYLEKRFGRNFRGYRQSQSQSLEWPRIDAADNDDNLMNGPDEIPRNLKKGCSEYALLALQLARNLAPPPVQEFATIDPEAGTTDSTGAGRLTKTSAKVGPIEESNSYDSSESASSRAPTVKMSSIVGSIPEYPQADLWIEELLKDVTSRRLVRGG